MKLPAALLFEDFKTKRAKFIEMGAAPEEVDGLITRFKALKKRNALDGTENDIDSYESIDKLREVVQAKEQVASRSQVKKKQKLEGVTVVEDTPKWLVLVPHNRDAAQLY